MVRKVNILSWGIDSWKNPKNWGKNIHQFFKNIKYASQRVAYGCSEVDPINLDEYLATVILNSVSIFKENHHGYPSRLENDMQWEAILEIIIKGFEDYLDNMYEPLQGEYAEGRKNTGFEYLAKYFSSLWS